LGLHQLCREHIDFANLTLKRNAEYKASANFISFAVEQGWYDPDSRDDFDVNAIYGEGTGRDITLFRTTGERVINPLTGEDVTNTTIVEYEERLRDAAPVTLEEMMALVRTPLLWGDSNGYGEVAHLRSGLNNAELATIWMAATGSVTTPFVPFYIGTETVPMEYGQHRYLYRGADATFVTKDWAIQEATDFAYRTFKQLMYFTCDHPDVFLPEVNESLIGYERRAIEEQDTVHGTADALIQAGHLGYAKQYLTDYTARKADEALEMGEGLLAGLCGSSRGILMLRSRILRAKAQLFAPAVAACRTSPKRLRRISAMEMQMAASTM
jgi:dipeptidase